MSITIIPLYYYPTYGGLQHFTNRLCSGLVERGETVDILSPPSEDNRDTFSELKPAPGINWRIVGSSRKEFWEQLPSLFPTTIGSIAFLGIEYECLIELQLSCIDTAIRKGHCVFVRLAATGDFKEVIAYLPKRLDIIQSVSAVIVPTEFMQLEVINVSHGKVQPIVIPNPIDNKYHPVPKEIKYKLRKCSGLPNIPIGVWAGRFDETKNLLQLLIAWHFSGLNGRLLLVGDDPYKNRAYRKRILQLIEELNIKSIMLHGHCLEINMPHLFQACDFYVSTSLKEGHSNASLEAAACGLPVVVYDIPGLRETVTVFKSPMSCLVPAHDIFAMAEAIKKIGHLAYSKENATLNTVPERHSPEYVISRYQKLFECTQNCFTQANS